MYKRQAIIVYTLVSENLLNIAKNFCDKEELSHVDLMTPLLKQISNKTGVKPKREPGIIRKLDESYFKRVEAIEFAVKSVSYTHLAIFNIYEGGLLCDLCSENTEENIKLDVTTIKLMEYILNNDILTCSKAKVSKYITYELEKVLKQYLNVYIDNVNFKSLYFLKDIENIKGADKGCLLYTS